MIVCRVLVEALIVYEIVSCGLAVIEQLSSSQWFGIDSLRDCVRIDIDSEELYLEKYGSEEPLGSRAFTTSLYQNVYWDTL